MEIACQAVFLGSCGLPERPFLARQLGEFSDNTACSVFRGAQGPQTPQFLVLRALRGYGWFMNVEIFGS